jgi:hypothetical protein
MKWKKKIKVNIRNLNWKVLFCFILLCVLFWEVSQSLDGNNVGSYYSNNNILHAHLWDAALMTLMRIGSKESQNWVRKSHELFAINRDEMRWKYCFM